ncbi:Mediator of RNA polymerase II transcription subunit 6 [Steccherinum ochraceum]|uniref:Mediator of RNA polymerase II transcription subunit 6 n=1 Tax=Steccherinum ochraceum TaxID=92696 RepID=A0A4R0RVE7_9APHY|nr:Mediator of RNA polymerase II transcription subunit 6 [Steccherinum ochraceum]
MDVSDLHPPDDYSHRFFIWHEWIQANGPLTNENVFDYFATSMFYDKQSNNQVLRMQTMHTGVPLANEAEELKRFTGVEFALVHSQPPSLFIIHKRNRVSPDETHPLMAYFIMNNRIYQSPDVYTLVSNRLLTSLHSLQTSLDTLRTRRPVYTPRTGFVWPISDPSLPEDGKKRDEEAEDSTTVSTEPVANSEDTEIVPSESDAAPKRKSTTGGDGKKRQNNMLLFNAMRTTALHSNQSFTLPASAAEKSAAEETPVVEGTVRSSPTPSAPAPPRAATPKSASSAPTPQETQPPKGLPGAGKKKKKRTSLAQPPAQS